MITEDQLKRIREFAAANMKQYDGGHDIWHLERVRKLALCIYDKEKAGNRQTIEIASLLHDIGDSKFGNSNIGDPVLKMQELLQDLKFDDKIIGEVIFINQNISFSKARSPERVSEEFKIVQDADRLDAIGAIGIARAFNYGGFRNNAIYDPEGKEESTIQHFYDKLLRLRDLMNTATGKAMAEAKHLYMVEFLDRFYSEWKGD